AAAACHLRHLVEREDQHLAVLADNRNGVACNLGDRARLVRHLDVENLLAFLRRANAIILVDDKALAFVACDEELATALVDEQRNGCGLLLHIDKQADRLAMTAAAGKLGDVERVELAVGGKQQELRRRLGEEGKAELVVSLERKAGEI